MEKRYGYCALCGKYGELSFEHIPPKSAFNKTPVKPVTGKTWLSNHNALPWDLNNLPYVHLQKGMGLWSLCRKCNNFTGTMYGTAYRDFAESVAKTVEIATKTGDKGVEISKIYPLRIVKQILSMFCSVNPPDMFNLDDLRAFVLDKDAVGIDRKKYRLQMYFLKNNIMKFNGFSAVIKFDPTTGSLRQSSLVSEITAFPLGFLLYLDPDPTQEYEGVDITPFASFHYEDMACIRLPIEIKEVNNIFPLDYRSKEEIIKTMNENKKSTQSQQREEETDE